MADYFYSLEMALWREVVDREDVFERGIFTMTVYPAVLGLADEDNQ